MTEKEKEQVIFRTMKDGTVKRITVKGFSIKGNVGTTKKKLAPPDASRLIARGIEPSDFDIERIKGTDELIIREKGQLHGTITEKDDFDRVLTHLEQQRRARLIQQGGQNRRLKL